MAPLQEHLPAALMNPYVAQDGFLRGDGNLFSAEDISVFAGLVDFFIAETVKGNPHLTRRIQYWLLMKAVLEDYAGDPSAVSRFMAGHGLWQCFQQDSVPGAG